MNFEEIISCECDSVRQRYLIYMQMKNWKSRRMVDRIWRSQSFHQKQKSGKWRISVSDGKL